jgi:soluble cytochrome b562
LANQKGVTEALKGMEDAINGMSKISKSKSIGAFADAFKAGDIENARVALENLRKNAENFGKNKAEYEGFFKTLEEGFNKLSSNTALQDKQKQLQNFMT